MAAALFYILLSRVCAFYFFHVVCLFEGARRSLTQLLIQEVGFYEKDEMFLNFNKIL